MNNYTLFNPRSSDVGMIPLISTILKLTNLHRKYQRQHDDDVSLDKLQTKGVK
jgi:hypothetical protein